MGKMIDRFKKSDPEPLEEGTNLALREIAGWPMETHGRFGTRNRHRTVVIQRDSTGRVVGSTEQLDEDEYHSYSDNWGQ